MQMVSALTNRYCLYGCDCEGVGVGVASDSSGSLQRLVVESSTGQVLLSVSHTDSLTD